MTFVSLLILIINFNIKVNIFVPFALLLTYEYLIISFLKDNFLTDDFKSKTIKDLSEYNFRRVNIYRKIIYFILTRPPKVRPKKSNFGGRYFYVKIQL